MTVFGCICITAAIAAAGYVILYPDRAGLHFTRADLLAALARRPGPRRLRDMPPGHPDRAAGARLTFAQEQAWDVIEAAYHAEMEDER